MEIALNIFQFFFDNIISKPQFFMGVLVLVGYLLLGKSILESLAGFVKAVVGYMILQIGSSGMVGAFAPILAGLQDKYSLNAAVIDPNFGFAAAEAALGSIGETTGWTMIVLLIGFLTNIVLIILKRFTKIRTLFTTGHIMVKQSGFLIWMVFFAIPSLRNINGAILTGILSGVYWAVFSNLTVEATERLIGERSFAIGHPQMFAIWITDKIAGKMGDKEKSVDKINLPPALKILSDNIIGTSVIMLIMFGTILAAIGPETMIVHDPAGVTGSSYFMYILTKSLSFPVNFIILQMGVKMFVNEIIEAFNGISEKLLKGAIPAVDVVATFGFADSKTPLIGFVAGTLGQFITILGLIVFDSPIMVISGFVPLFFDNAAIAIFANNRGGAKPAVILPFFSGIIQVLGGALGIKMFEMYLFGGWYGNFDFATVWIVFGQILKSFALPGIIAIILIMMAIPQLQYIRNKKNYFDEEGDSEDENISSVRSGDRI